MWEHRATGLQQWIATDPVRMRRLETFGLKLGEQLASAAARTPAFRNADVERLLRTRRGGRRWFSTDEDDDWRLTAYVPARFNRLVVYPTWQIHSVVDTSGLAPTRDDARLTYNQMVEFPIARELTRSRTPYPRAFYRRF